MISRFPNTIRSPHLVKSSEYSDMRDGQLPEVWFGSFSTQFPILLNKSPFPAMIHLSKNENSDFADMVYMSKSIYLSSEVVYDCENVMYSSIVKEKSSNVISSLAVFDNSSNVYESKFVMNSTDVFYSTMIINSYRIYNSSNLVWCQYCIDCNDIQNQKYCINNQKVTPEEFDGYLKTLQFHKPHNRGHNVLSTNITNGDCNYMCEQVENVYGNYSVKWGRNIFYHGGKDPSEYIYDMFRWGRSNHIYGSLDSGKFCEHIYNSFFIVTCQNVFYSMFLENCSFCLGCIGLKNKSYCIYNKQYTKEDRYEKVNEIFTQMERDWQLWEFFPATMNPFYFNDTAAYLIDPSFTKEEVTAKWYLRRDEPIKVDIPEGMEVVYTSSPSLLLSEKGDHKTLDDFEWFDDQGNWTINADILKKVIQDEQWNVYRIIPMEYKFLVKHGLPLPRKHWLERMKENFRIS